MTQDLRRVIGLPHATAMVAGTIIGASIFVQPSEITGRVPSVAGVMMVWCLSGFLTLIGALICAELASIYTQTGGIYVYLREIFSPAVGFLWGWAMLWSMHSGIIAAIAVIFARYTAYFFPMSEGGIKLAAIGVILALSGVNYFGVRQGSRLQTVLTAGKVGAIILVILAGFTFGARLPVHFSREGLEGNYTISDMLLALIAGLFSFGGWHMVTYSSGETIQPRKTIPRSLMLGSIIVTASYLAMNAVYMFVLPLSRVASSTRIAADAADALFGGGGGALMSVLVVFSTFGSLSGIILCGPRVYYSMSRDGLLFRWIGNIHPRYRTPHHAIAVQAVVSSALVGTGTYRALFTRVVYTEWIFFGLLGIGLAVLRRRGRIPRDFGISGHPVILLIFVIFSFAIVLNQVFVNPEESLVGLSLVLLGMPVYYFWVSPRVKEVT